MNIDAYKSLKIYKKDSLYASFLFSYPSSYVLNKQKKEFFQINEISWDSLLYIHIPFCLDICKFCNVYKEKLVERRDLKNYLNQLEKEIFYFSKKMKNISIKWIYIWWGTPTLLEAGELDLLFSLLFWNFNIDKDAYIEIDAYPSTLTKEKLEVLMKNWVKQLSIWVQSMNQDVLKNVSRLYQNDIIFNNLSILLKDYNFNLHFDFIVWLPWEDVNMVEAWIRQIAEKFSVFSISVNGYDNTIDTLLFSEYKDLFNDPNYQNNKKEYIDRMEKILKEEYWVERKKTYYFDNFFKKQLNVIWLWAGAYWFIKWKWVYQNLKYPYYLNENNYMEKISLGLSETDEKVMFLVHNYDDENININYKNVFWTEIFSDFSQQIIYLRGKWLVCVNNSGVSFLFKNNQIAKFWLTIFYSQNIVSKYEA